MDKGDEVETECEMWERRIERAREEAFQEHVTI